MVRGTGRDEMRERQKVAGQIEKARALKLADFLFFFFALNKDVDRTSDKPKMLCSLDQDFER